MKISEMIGQLEKILEEKGDLDVVARDEDGVFKPVKWVEPQFLDDEVKIEP